MIRLVTRDLHVEFKLEHILKFWENLLTGQRIAKFSKRAHEEAKRTDRVPPPHLVVAFSPNIILSGDHMLSDRNGSCGYSM